MQDAHAGSTTTCFSGTGRAMPDWLAGSPLRAYHASRARVQSMGHSSTLCLIDTCQGGRGLPPCPNDTCQWGMGQQACARLTCVIWNTSQSGTLHRNNSVRISDEMQPFSPTECCRAQQQEKVTHMYCSKLCEADQMDKTPPTRLCTQAQHEKCQIFCSVHES